MSTAADAKVQPSDIQLVQNLIERCLQLYMSQREVTVTLQNSQAGVEPGFTQLVWQKLEEQNPDFFRAYYTRHALLPPRGGHTGHASPDTHGEALTSPWGPRLKLKDQIVLFNHLLEQQVQIYHKIQHQGWTPPGAPLLQAATAGQAPSCTWG